MNRVNSAAQALELVVVVSNHPADRDARLLVREPSLVGGSGACELCLNDPDVSRRHLSVEPCNEGLRIVDLSSQNGVWLGDAQRLESAVVAPGERIRVGGTWLEVRRNKSEHAPALKTEFGDFVGSSPRAQNMYRDLARAAATDLTVLIEGESGVGKELIARGIHEESERRDGPFVVVDCSALSERLIESELFGHEAGAFTGAIRRHAGAFEQAQGGTIFLDEIGELPARAQSRLLRVLAARNVRRVGGDAPIPIDVRVVAATNRNLDREVEEGRFRLDLYYRLSIVLVRVPALRERKEDIPAIASRLLEALGADPSLLTPEHHQQLQAYDYPGNVRELRNQLERFGALGELELPSKVEPRLDGIICSGRPFKDVRAECLEVLSKVYVKTMLDRYDGNVTQAAEAAGLDRRYFQRIRRRVAI